MIWGEVVCSEKFNISPTLYVKELLAADLKKLFLANAAAHPQYTGELLSDFKDNPYQNIPLNIIGNKLMRHDSILRSLKDFAIKHGCAKNNKTLLF